MPVSFRVSAVLCAALALSTTSARAQQGIVFNTGGTRALSRGGAVAARAEDPMVLLYNPAGLADIQGKQILFSLDMPFHSACVQPYGYYGWGIYEPGVSEFGDSGQVERDADGNPTPGQYATQPLDEVCDSGRTLPVPELAFTWRVNDELGVGFGFVGPSLLVEQQWGGADGTISRNGVGRPTPTRYQLVRQEVTFALAPTIGVGYRVLPILRVGAAFQWTALGIESSVVQAQGAGTSPHNDMIATVRAHDYFVPAATFSIHATPIDPVDIVFSFLWRDSFEGEGEAVYETNPYTRGLTEGGIAHVNEPIRFDRVHQPLPWAMTLGARYADRIAPRQRDAAKEGEPASDPLATERWDVELDVAWLLNARASVTTVTLADTCERDAAGNRIQVGARSRGCQNLEFRRRDASGEVTRDFLDVPPESFGDVSVNRYWKNQVAIRLGGSYNVIPSKLGINAGIYYESRGVYPDYASVDNLAFRRIGTGLGAVFRVGRFDLLAAYGHIFQETLEVMAPPHQNREQAGSDPSSGFDKRIGQPCPLTDPTCTDPRPLEEQNKPTDPDGVAKFKQGSFIEQGTSQRRVVNAGRYSSSFDVISVGAIYRF
jgi:long-subunit fatty acid transport protein